MSLPTRIAPIPFAARTGAIAALVFGGADANAQSLRRPAPEQVHAIFAMYDSATTPGCGVAVLHGDSVVFRRAYGRAHVGFQVPMTTSTTLWMPYSEARVFVAVAVGLLARDERISLDAPVARYVPEMPAYASAVTIRHLLHHTSGLADYGVLDPSFDSMNGRLPEPSMFRALARWGKLGNAPGTAQVYSNTDYALLRLVVERVTQGSLHAFLKERVLEPLGMRDTRIGADQADVVPNHALFYETGPRGWRTVLRYRSSPTGGISVTTSVDDMVQWARALRDPAQRFDSLLVSLERGKPDPAALSGLAYGVHAVTLNGHAGVSYHGVGDYTYLVRVPDVDLSVVTLCNSYEQMFTFGPAVAELYLPATTVAQAPTPSSAIAGTNAPTVPLASNELRRWTGDYVRIDGRGDVIRIMLQDSVLRIGPNPTSSRALRPLAADRFEAVAPGIGVFHVSFVATDTVPGGLLVLTRDARTGAAEPALRRNVPLASKSLQELQAYTGSYVGDDIDATLHVLMVDDRLMVEARALGRIDLVQLAGRDRFRFDIYEARFGRDASGRVTHVVLDAARVKGMRYTRVVPSNASPRRR